MTLLSPLALLFGLIAVVPLILHLQQNRKRTVMLFSTNRFFTDAIIRTQRRFKIRRRLLLFLRMAACLLLALALSQPILAWSGLTFNKGNRDLVILLDDSLSVSAPQSPAMTAFGLGRDQALAALDQLVTGDRAAIVTTTGRVIADPAGTSPSDDLLDLRSRLANLQPTESAGDNPAALRTTAELFHDYEQGRARAVLILTDGQASDWRSGQWPALPLGCATQVVCLASPPTDNVTADHITLATPGNAAVIGRPNALTVRIVNHDPARRKAQVHLLVNDRLEADQSIQLPGESAGERTFPVTFTAPGLHRIQFQLLGLHDALPADDTLLGVVRVESQLPVLLVHGPQAANDRSGAFYLRAALQAVGGSEADVKVQSITADELTAAKLSGYRVVMLCDVPRLSSDSTAALRQFVAQGGGMAIFPGSHIDAAWYNANLADLLPAAIGPPLAITDRPLPIVQADITHPLLSRFSDDLRAAISGITVSQARDLKPHDAWLIAQLDGDHPFITQRPYQNGSVVLFASDPQPQSTNLPLRRLFIPLVHRLAAYLASTHSTTPLAFAVGAPLTLTADTVKFNVDHPPAAQGPGNLAIATQVISHGTTPRLAFTPPAPGFYTVGPAVIAANTPRSESSALALSTIDPVTSADWHVTMSSTPNITALLAASHSGRGYWHTLLYIVLIIILLEPLIANYAKPAKREAVAKPRQSESSSAALGSSDSANKEAA